MFLNLSSFLIHGDFITYTGAGSSNTAVTNAHDMIMRVVLFFNQHVHITLTFSP